MKKFKGYLPSGLIEIGISFCLQNASDLLNECKLLIRKKMYARAMVLSLTCLEEIGKIRILRTINRIPKKNQKLRSQKWNQFYDHKFKSAHGFVHSFPDDLKRDFESYMAGVFHQFMNAPLSEEIRQIALYTDYSEEDKMWISPRTITKRTATYYFKIANQALVNLEKIRDFGLYSERVLEIEKGIYSDLFQDSTVSLSSPQLLTDTFSLGPEKAREFWKRIIDEGIIKESDLKKITLLV